MILFLETAFMIVLIFGLLKGDTNVILFCGIHMIFWEIRRQGGE